MFRSTIFHRLATSVSRRRVGQYNTGTFVLSRNSGRFEDAGGPVMHRLIIATTLVLAAAVGGYTQTGRLATNSSSPSYGKEQADRGKVVYSRYCSKCHLENLKGNCPSEDLSSTSYICAAPGSAPPLTGASFMHRFYSVGDLYSRVKWTMPVDKVVSLSVEDNLSV